MSELSPIGKWLIALGVMLIIAGIILNVGRKFSFFGSLPGDMHIERGDFNFYFPLTTCLLLSILISIICLIISRFK